MRVIVTGATGLIGRAITRDLLAKGHEVEAWTRSPVRAAPLLPAQCAIVEWSSNSIPEASLASADAVIHLAGENVAGGRWTMKRKAELVRSRVDSTKAIVSAIADLPSAQRPGCLIAASAIGYYGHRGEEILEENAPAGSGFMPDLCARWEAQALEAETFGVRSVAVRVGIVLDRDQGMLAPVLPLFRTGLAGRIGSGQQWMSWIHVDDIAALFVHALETESIRGAINGAAPHPVRNAEFTKSLAAAVRRPAFLPAPRLALRLAFGEMSDIMLASQRLAPTVAEQAGFTFRYPRLDGALTAICSSDEHELVFEQIVSQPVDRAFTFFADPKNLEAITPPFLRFSIRKAPAEGIQSESRLLYRLRVHGLPLRWRTRIAEWQPPNRFVDVQEKGPYSLWHHTHELESVDEDRTLIRDRVRYRLPFGALGQLVAGNWVARDLDEIFRYRHERVAQHMQAREGTT